MTLMENPDKTEFVSMIFDLMPSPFPEVDEILEKLAENFIARPRDKPDPVLFSRLMEILIEQGEKKLPAKKVNEMRKAFVDFKKRNNLD